MTKSGFYRYCLAKEVGYDEDCALRVAENPSAGNFAVIESAAPVAVTYSAKPKPKLKPKKPKP